MKYQQGLNRDQLAIFPVSVDAAISQENEIRLLDVFVESLDMKELGFRMDHTENGRPAYHPKDLLKLFLYGYMNKMRSSRDLEKECYRNMEVIWLLKGLRPDHNTISNFRRDNPNAIKKVFRATVALAKNFNLIGGKLLAGDSTKLRAQNSKKNNFNQKKIERQLEYIENKLHEYQQQLAANDGDHELTKKQIETQQVRKQSYEKMQKQLAESGEVQISTSDPESRQMITRNNITEVAYNVQSTVDAKHYIPIDFKVTNQNDSKAMGSMVRRAKSILGTSHFSALYDKGFHTGTELKIAQQLGVETIVAIPDTPTSSQAPNPAYNVSQFYYNTQSDTYTCPQQHVLTTNGRWYDKHQRKHIIRVKHYKTAQCKTCPVIAQCTLNTGGRGRVIERSEYAPYYETNRRNVDNKEHLYKRRQAIVEHPFGIIKRQWGFYYITTKQTIKRASADVGLMFTAYNLRRIINIIGIEAFRRFVFTFFLFLQSFLASLELFWRRHQKQPKNMLAKSPCLQRMYLLI